MKVKGKNIFVNYLRFLGVRFMEFDVKLDLKNHKPQ